MLLVPVTLRRDDDKSAASTRITTCQVPAQATLANLQQSIVDHLGPQAALTGFTYRGCRPALSTSLQACSAGSSLTPRFTARYSGQASGSIRAATSAGLRPAAGPKNIQVFVKVCADQSGPTNSWQPGRKYMVPPSAALMACVPSHQDRLSCTCLDSVFQAACMSRAEAAGCRALTARPAV